MKTRSIVTIVVEHGAQYSDDKAQTSLTELVIYGSVYILVHNALTANERPLFACQCLRP